MESLPEEKSWTVSDFNDVSAELDHMFYDAHHASGGGVFPLSFGRSTKLAQWNFLVNEEVAVDETWYKKNAIFILSQIVQQKMEILQAHCSEPLVFEAVLRKARATARKIAARYRDLKLPVSVPEETMEKQLNRLLNDIDALWLQPTRGRTDLKN